MSKYLSEMEALGLGLVKELLPRHKAAVINDLERLGGRGWHDWFFANRQDCLEYLAAASATRKKKKWTGDTQNHHRLILGAVVLHRAAVLFQELWEQHGDCRGLGYRDAHKAAALSGWNAMVSFRRFSYYPLDFLDELLDLADE